MAFVFSELVLCSQKMHKFTSSCLNLTIQPKAMFIFLLLWFFFLLFAMGLIFPPAEDASLPQILCIKRAMIIQTTHTQLLFDKDCIEPFPGKTFLAVKNSHLQILS